MARIDVIMPQMGESIAEGTLSRWLKKVGDPVKRDEPIFEISTDKVDAEIPAPTAGMLAEIMVQEGQTVAVQTLVARIETEAGAVAATPAAGPAPRRRARPGTSAGAVPPLPRAPRPRRRRPRPRQRRLRRHGQGERRRDARGAPPPALHAAGPQDRRRARPRHLAPLPGSGHGRPGHEERRPVVSRGAAGRAPPRRRPRARPGAGARRRPPRRRRCRAIPLPSRGRATGSSRGRGSASSPPIT